MIPLKEEFLEILSNYQGILHKVSFAYFLKIIFPVGFIPEIGKADLVQYSLIIR